MAEVRPRSREGRRWAGAACYVRAAEELGSVWGSSREGPSAAAAFLIWSHVKGSASGESGSLPQTSSLFHGIQSILGLCIPPLVLLVVNSGCCQPAFISVTFSLSCNVLGCLRHCLT